jgi:transcriptional regulator with XRE-family HTH domain
MFTKRFRKLQKQKAWTISETAKRIGVSNDTISTYRRDSTPSFKHVVKIAKAFDVSLEFLITGSEKKPKSLNDFNAFQKYFLSCSAKERNRIKEFMEMTD